MEFGTADAMSSFGLLGEKGRLEPLDLEEPSSIVGYPAKVANVAGNHMKLLWITIGSSRMKLMETCAPGERWTKIKVRELPAKGIKGLQKAFNIALERSIGDFLHWIFLQ